LFAKNNSTIEDQIDEIQQAISNTYANYMIVIIIDEIDRVEKKELVKI
jgi:replication-associated recombination protein RarA